MPLLEDLTRRLKRFLGIKSGNRRRKKPRSRASPVSRKSRKSSRGGTGKTRSRIASGRRKGKRPSRRSVRKRSPSLKKAGKSLPKRSPAKKKKVARKKPPVKSSRRKPPRKKARPSSKNAFARPGRSGALAAPALAEVTHYFPKIMVCVLKMNGPLSVGDTVRIHGGSTDFVQKVQSMQIESINVSRAKKNQLVGLKVIKPCREGDRVYPSR